MKNHPYSKLLHERTEYRFDSTKGAERPKSLHISNEEVCFCRGSLRELLECAQNAQSAEFNVSRKKMEHLKWDSITNFELEQLNICKQECALLGLRRVCSEIVKINRSLSESV